MGTGHTMTTEAQKTFSVESPEAKLLKELIASQTTDSTLVSSKKIAELEEIVRIQASTLDKVVFETEFVNMPKNFGVVEKTILDVITAYLWPYYTPSASTLSQPPPPPPPHHGGGRLPDHLMETSSRSTVELTFAQTIPALNMKIVTPRETLVFKNIRIVYPLDLFFPLTASRTTLSSVSPRSPPAPSLPPAPLSPRCAGSTPTPTPSSSSTARPSPSQRSSSTDTPSWLLMTLPLTAGSWSWLPQCLVCLVTQTC